MFKFVLVIPILLGVVSASEFWDVMGFDLEQFFTRNPDEKSSSKVDPSFGVSNSTYNYLVAGTLIAGGVVLAVAALFWIDIYATARIDEFLLDYYGPQLYDQYTNRFDPNDSTSPVGLRATTANEYYGFRRSFETNYFTDILQLLSEAHETYSNKQKNL